MNRILIVDDSTDAVMMVSRMLARLGYEVEAARSGGEALKLASVFQPNVVFLDLRMPQMDGYETAKRLRRIEGLAQTKIVAVSGAPPDQSRLDDASIDMQLLKPAGLEQLLEAMGEHRRLPPIRRR
jgi:CheY-like chemotaxis protein